MHGQDELVDLAAILYEAFRAGSDIYGWIPPAENLRKQPLAVQGIWLEVARRTRDKLFARAS